MAQLHKSLFNQEWLIIYPDSLLEYGAHLFFYHSLMHIHVDKAIAKGKKPFRFSNMCCTYPQFLKVIRSTWNNNMHNSPPSMSQAKSM